MVNGDSYFGCPGANIGGELTEQPEKIIVMGNMLAGLIGSGGRK